MQQLAKLFLYLAVLVTIGCSWHLRSTISVPPQLKKILFNSGDLNGPLSQAIRKQLRLNNFELVEKDSIHQGIPLFRILNYSLSKDAVSIFQYGYAEYQIMLSINAGIQFSGEENYSINTKVYRSFFDNPQNALAKDIEQQIIINEMYDKAAEQLIYKLLNIILLASLNTNTVDFNSMNKPNVSTIPGK